VRVDTANNCSLWWEAYPLNASTTEANGCDVNDSVVTHVKLATNGVMSWHIVNMEMLAQIRGIGPATLLREFLCATRMTMSRRALTGMWSGLRSQCPQSGYVANFGSEYFKAPQAYRRRQDGSISIRSRTPRTGLFAIGGSAPCSPQVVLVSPGVQNGFSGFTRQPVASTARIRNSEQSSTWRSGPD